MNIEERVQQIRAAHASAKPNDANPAWKNSHADCAVLLEYIDRRAEQPQPAPMQVDSTDAEGELRRVFEKWHDKEFPNDSLLRHVAGYYADHSVNNRWKAVWAVCSALASRAEHAVPEGWKLVPIEPTNTMCEAAYAECRKFGVQDCAVHLWDAMLNAAPTSNNGE